MASSQHPALDDPNVWVPYRYEPSRVGAIIFMVFFALTTLLHCVQLLRKPSWILVPLVMGGFCEITGYVGRYLSTENIWALGPYIMQSILLLIAPAFFAASVYVILGRIMILVKREKLALIHRIWITRLFVCGDVLALLLQSGGGGIQAMGTLSALNLGNNIIIAGLFVQVTSFALFFLIAIDFHRRMVADPIYSLATDDAPWRKYLYSLYVASCMILIRSIFRIVEYLMGNDGHLLRHEVFLYVFDATLMLIVMVTFNCVHPHTIEGLNEKRIESLEQI